MAGLQLIRPWYNYIVHAPNGKEGTLSKDKHCTPDELLKFILTFRGEREFYH
jgi:hypothetical protein